MIIIFILLALVCFILGIWLFKRYSNVSLPQQQPPSKVPHTETLKPPQPNKLSTNDSKTNLPLPPVLPQKPLRRLPLSHEEHQQNIASASLILQQIRIHPRKQELPYVIGTLRKVTPYIFEELLLFCCLDQGWKIQRNNAYSGDGGVDGRTWILGKLYVIQAKRYEKDIKLQHVYDFKKVIQQEQAQGGFFIHSGKTGIKSKEALNQNPQIILISGQKLVNFVLGKNLKIVGVTF